MDRRLRYAKNPRDITHGVFGIRDGKLPEKEEKPLNRKLKGLESKSEGK